MSQPLQKLNQLAISPSGFVFDPVSGVSYTVNPTARVLMEGVRDGLGLAQLVARIEDGFEVEGADVARDILEYTRILVEQGLLPRSFELEA